MLKVVKSWWTQTHLLKSKNIAYINSSKQLKARDFVKYAQINDLELTCVLWIGKNNSNNLKPFFPPPPKLSLIHKYIKFEINAYNKKKKFRKIFIIGKFKQ